MQCAGSNGGSPERVGGGVGNRVVWDSQGVGQVFTTGLMPYHAASAIRLDGSGQGQTPSSAPPPTRCDICLKPKGEAALPSGTLSLPLLPGKQELISRCLPPAVALRCWLLLTELWASWGVTCTQPLDAPRMLRLVSQEADP